MSNKDETGLYNCAKKTAESQDWSVVVLRTIWDIADLNAELARCMAFNPDDLTTEKKVIDKLTDTILSAYTLAYKLGTKEVGNSMKRRVAKRLEFLENK